MRFLSMDRTVFGQILDSIVVPQGLSDDEVNKAVFPISKASFQMMPPRLFRYRLSGEKQIEAFEKDIIYAVTADKYNDPYDTLAKCDIDDVKRYLRDIFNVNTLLSLKDFLNKGNDFPDEVKMSNPNVDWAQIRSEFLMFDDIDKLKDRIETTMSQVDSQMNLFMPILADFSKRFSAFACFSESMESMLMWSHYADSHQGFALEYDFRPTLAQPLKGVLVLPVIYSEERFNASTFMLWAFMTFAGVHLPNPDLTAHLKIALHKSLDWAYEKEWRMIEASPRNPFDTSPVTVQYKPAAIYYGYKMTLEMKQYLHQVALSKDLREYEMYIDYYSPKYEMKYRPYSDIAIGG